MVDRVRTGSGAVNRRKRSNHDFPSHAPHSSPPRHPHMGSKNKVKKAFTPSPSAPNNNAIDDNADTLVDDLLAELNSRDSTVQRESATVLEEIQTRQQSEAGEADVLDKAGSKNKFKARQVRLGHRTCSSRVTSLSSRQGKPQLLLTRNHPSTPLRMRSWSERPRTRNARLVGYAMN